MKVKIFHTNSNSSLETRINDFLEKNQLTLDRIVNITQSSASRRKGLGRSSRKYLRNFILKGVTA